MRRFAFLHNTVYEVFLDKLILWMICAIFCYQANPSIYIISYVLFSLAIGCFLAIWKHKAIQLFLHCIYWLLCLMFPTFIVFLPLVIYDIFFQDLFYLIFVYIAVMLIVSHSSTTNIYLILFSLLAFLLRRKTMQTITLHSDAIALRDQNKEIMMKLEERNVQLIERQDFEVNLATLNERNRIAREIHDTIGHQLTRSILQLGALQITTSDDAIKNQVTQVKQSLDEGMNSIRASIHQLYDDSIDLPLEVQKLIDQFTHCPIRFHYQIRSMLSKKLKYAFLAIIRECITNMTKHSNATQCTITIKEHPGFLQMRIKDNGTNASHDTNQGIGLNGIEERVHQLQGYCKITTEDGFQVFITIPKED